MNASAKGILRTAALLAAAAGAASALCLKPVMQAKLGSEDAPAPDDFFGTAVSFSGDTCVVTANGKSLQRGAAYAYVRDRLGIWTQEAKLVGDDVASGSSLGDSVSLQGDTVVVGASGNDATPGAAYVFTRTAGLWT